jgi:membrane protein
VATTVRGTQARVEAARQLWEKLGKRPLVATVSSFIRHNGITTAAALAFYFLMSLFPFLIFLASALALLPISHLSARMAQLAAHFVPKDAMPVVDSVLAATMHTNHRLLSIGFLLAVVSASSAIVEMAFAFNIIYEVTETRPFWRRRLEAVYMTFAVGGMTFVAVIAMLLGPHLVGEIARVFDVNQTFVALWPFIRHVLAVACALASIELLYYLGPDRKHTLREQLPGSVFAVVVWIASTLGLGIYLSDFGNLNAMYGTLASFIVLMIWLQISAMAILLGAALNAELARAKQARAGVARSQ